MLVQAGRLAPISEFYPHPEIEALFEHKKEMEITSECVAAWAGGSAWGIRTKDRKIRKEIIIGIYGGKITKNRGIYVLDATVLGDDIKWIDGDPDLGDIAMFGRINEDIHDGVIKKNPLVVLFGKTNQKAKNGFLSKRSDKHLQNCFKPRQHPKFG